MEKRFLLAVALSFIVLYGYQALFPPPKPSPAGPSSNAPAASASQSAQAGESKPPQPSTPSIAEAPAEPQPAALVGDSAERDIVVDNPAVHAVFTTRGAVLKSWTLKRYKDTAGAPLDLVPQIVKGAAKPFSLVTEDGPVSTTMRTALFKPSADALNVTSGAQTLSFEYRDAAGLSVRKDFTFQADQPYIVGFTASVTHNGTALNPTVHWGPALGNGVIERSGTYNPPPQPLFYKDGTVTRLKPNKIQGHPVEEGTFGFAGVDDHYFLTASVDSAQAQHIEYLPVSVPIEGSETGANFVAWSTRFASPPQGARYFAGPKDFDVLVAIDRNLVRAIDFGMFSWLVVPLLRALKWINGYLGNYGWSIIALTVLINLVMFPLRHKSVVSMRKMQEVQPEVKAIQDRYAKLKMSDPARQKMNVELMNLYRERGVNPASGCVPMLLTLPVLFAFYAMLSVAIELRGAPFIGWIKDLSIHDPLYVTPVIMGLTMLVQQKMTPTSADPVQQKMMMFMPLVFTSMFVLAPSGLVLYWTVSNLWAIGQQALTNKLIGPSTARAPRPAAERRVKSAGSGRTEQAGKERK
jgi:YidC/Oxa1 family membrane protein insertase